MSALDSTLRNTLETVIVKARSAAESAAESALKRLAVHERAFYPSMTDEQKVLRRALRAKGRQLGDGLEKSPDTPLDNLIREAAYEHWHQMLFAKFLAENDLLMHPEGVPVTLRDCEDLAQEEGDADGWATATRYASTMLPGIFSQGDPVHQLRFAPEDRHTLERLIAQIPVPTYRADDGLGWVYQFWQTSAKKAVNAGGDKVGGADISAVTQLFTEHYMVQFLLHNTLGAWWVSRHPDTPLPTDTSYLRTLEDDTPAAGTFEGWPDAAKDLTVMDPCCGSGHFLVAAFALLKRFRMIEEDLSEREAGDAVIRDNLHGLELDPRCTQIAAFNLALEAWKSGGYRTLPPLNIACSGISVGGSESDWTGLAKDDPKAQKSLSRLYHLFRDAPDLGSLIDPTRLDERDPLYTSSFSEVEALLDKALRTTQGDPDPVAAVFGDAAQGVTRAAKLLRGKYHLVITNVPYLARGKQSDTLRDYVERTYPNGKADLATAFVERCRGYAKNKGTYALVTPQNWLFLGSYKHLRKDMLEKQSWGTVARLGAGAFETISGEVVNVALLNVVNQPPAKDHTMTGLDVSDEKTPEEKAQGLLGEEVKRLEQAGQLENPDARVVLEVRTDQKLLEEYAIGLAGILNGDSPKFQKMFWELLNYSDLWVFQQSTVESTMHFGGRQKIILYDEINGHLRESAEVRREKLHDSDQRGNQAWGKWGIAVSQMRNLPISLYNGNKFDSNVAVILPKSQKYLPAIWTYCSSQDYCEEVRKIDQKVNVTNATLVKVPFDLEYWQKVAEEKYPNGLPEPYSNDPTQWLFNGSIVQSSEPLQVAVARLLGYAWPEQGKSTEAHPFPKAEEKLDELIDGDGIVCLPAVAGEQPAAERLRALLARAYGSRWTPTLQEALLTSVGFGGKDLGAWLRDGFFKQHAKLFGNRPFVWHVWDGRKDGFSALVNYHTLDRAKLGRLIYTYLGAWLDVQRDAARQDVQGADLRLAAAQALKGKLEAILEGEPPYDIYVRWKPLHEQPVGWEPDLNDGVRLNVRPFVEAGVLRSKFTVNWKKDRGKDPAKNLSGTVERHNDLHLTRAEKLAARAAAGTAVGSEEVIETEVTGTEAERV